MPKQFRPAWWAGAVTAVLGAYAARRYGVPEMAGAWAYAATAAGAAVTGALVHSVGDAARYLAVRPDNLAIRRDIRTAGVGLLRHLHDSGRYHRIVVVGHSLGSVIGYDVLRLYWAEVADRHGSPASPATAALAAYEKDAPGASAGDHQKLQHALWREMRANGAPWLVTDFITAGSPLTHAEVLLTTGPTDLAQRKKDRELPTCPPEPDARDGGFSYPVQYVGGELRVLHHGAPFGPVRWTNLYFPTTLVFFGDAVGGPLAPVLGPGIKDVAVTNKKWSKRRTPKAHSSYWLRGEAVDAQARAAMIRALGLDSSEELAALAAQRPLADFLPKASM